MAELRGSPTVGGMTAPALALVPAPASDQLALRAAIREAVAALRGVASHQDAALLLGIELVEPSPLRHVTVARRRTRLARTGTKVHRSDVDRTLLVDGIPVTTGVRTVLDLCRSLPLREAVVAGDSALRKRRVTLPELVDAAAQLPPALGRPQVRAVVTRLDPLSGSVLESLCRLVLEDAGLRPFETQHVVRVGRRRIGRFDFAWPSARLVVEVDGFAFHADRASYRNDRRRTNELVLAGWRVLRFSWEDVLHHPDVVVEQVRRALGP